MIYFMIFYVYLAIHRPMEIWQSLGDLRPELIFFTLMTLAWAVAGKRLRCPPCSWRSAAWLPLSFSPGP
jgi:hypothetical protein